MTPEMWAVAISNIMFGFIVGLSVEALSNSWRIETTKKSLQKAVDIVFQKDREIDELKKELEEVRSQYVELYEPTHRASALLSFVLKDLPPPSGPLERCEQYVDTSLPRLVEFPDPQTPAATCVPSSTD